MTRKILLVMLALSVSLMTTGSTATEPPVPKPAPKPPIPKHLAQHQTKVNEIKKTQEGKEIFRLVDIASEKHGVDKRLVHAIILAESGYDKNARSSAGAVGLMQLVPKYRGKGYTNLYDKQQNIDCGTRHIAGLLAKYDGDEMMALSAYNAGGGAVDRSLKRTGRIPQYTRPYVSKVIQYKAIF